MNHPETLVAAVIRGRRRRTLGLAAVVVGVFIAVLDLQASSLFSRPVPVPLFEGLGGLIPSDVWVSQAIYASLVIASLPLWGKLSDVYGRGRLWLVGLLLFMAGSAASAFAEDWSFELWILMDFVQALAIGAIGVLGRALIGDLYPPWERAKWHGLLAAAVGLGLFGEPTIRLLLSHLAANIAPVDERVLHSVLTPARPWTLYVNLPVGGLVILASWFGLRGLQGPAQSSVDLRGALVLVGTAVLLLLPSWVASAPGPGAFHLLSAPALALHAGAAILIAVLVVLLRRAPDPLISLRLLTNRTYLIAILCSFLVTVTLNNFQSQALGINYLGFFSAVQGINPFRFLEQVIAGLAFAVGAVVAGRTMWRTGDYVRPILVLLAIGIVGALLLSRLTIESTAAELALGMAVTGLGLGGLTAVLITAVQNDFPHRSLGEVTAGLGFFGALGAGLAAPLFGWLSRTSYANVVERSPADSVTSLVRFAGQMEALRVVFLATAILLVVGFLLAFLLTEPLGRWATVFRFDRRASLAEIFRVREEEQRRALEAARSRREQRRRAIDATGKDADTVERPADGPHRSES